MHLRAHVSTLVRKRESSHLRAVLVADPCSWPFHLRLPWNILREELSIAPQAARALIARGLKAAHESAWRMNERTQAAEVHERSRKVKAAFGHLSNCTKRAPTRLRHMLDEKVLGVLESGDVNIEVIEAVFQTSRTVLSDS
jgi:hypothetical protein